MAFRSFTAASLDDAQADYKSAQRVEQYRVSSRAIYQAAFPGVQYLPFSSVTRAWVQSGSMRLTACCGKELPVTVLRVQYEDRFYQNFTFEKAGSARTALDCLAAARPEIPLERERPATGVTA